MPQVRVNGVEHFYETAGQGPGLALIHGLSLTHRMWDAQYREFASRYQTVRYDLRGHGQSAAPQTGYQTANLADDLHGLLTHLKITSTYLVGLSLGGQVALEYTLRYSDTVKALVLVDTALEGHRWSEPIAAYFHRVREGAKKLGVERTVKELWLNGPLFAVPNRNPTLAKALAEMILPYSGSYWLDEKLKVPEEPQIQRLKEVKCPTLVVVGSLDLIDFQAMADIAGREIPGARKVVLARSGHLPPLERPEALNTLVLDFLAAVERGDGRAPAPPQPEPAMEDNSK
ncbi:MAG: alpha/beta fold hydrolase [Deinococcus sp.]|nr:alpha/beta fold hydrolase [Deinococcus sp.]